MINMYGNMKPRLRNFTLLALGFLFVLGLAVHLYPRPEKDMREAIQQAISDNQMLSHYDEEFGFYVRYPDFFQVCEDSQRVFQNYFRSVYEVADVRIILESYATPHSPMKTKDEFRLARPLLQTDSSLVNNSSLAAPDSFVVDVPYSSCGGNGNLQPDYVYHAKYVRRQGMWFVQSLIFPDDYRQALDQLILQIDEWSVTSDFWMPSETKKHNSR